MCELLKFLLYIMSVGGLYKGHGASREKWGQEENKLFKAALPQRSGALLHTQAHRPQLLTKALSSMWV